MILLDRHLVRTFVPPFVFGLSVITFLLMIDVLEQYFNLFLEKGIPFAVATEVLFLSLGHTFALSIPMAVLVGTLMSVGHLSADAEITAMKACGVSLWRITRPLLLIGLATAAAMVAYNNYVLPDSNHRLRNLLIDINQLRPTLVVKPNTFAQIDAEHSIFVRSKDDRSGELGDVLLFKRNGRADPTPDVIVAEHGLLQTIAPGRLQLDLYNGEHHRMPEQADASTYHRTDFQRQTFHFALDMGDGGSRGVRQRGEREMDVPMLATAARGQVALAREARQDAGELLERIAGPALEELQSPPPDFPPGRDLSGEYRILLNRVDQTARALALKQQVVKSHLVRGNRYRGELHKKFSIPVACIVFVVLGVPLAVVSGRGGRGVSVGFSVLAFLAYYLMLSGGEKLADRGMLPAWAGMWTPNLVLGTIGLFLLHATVQETRTVSLRWPWKARRRGAAPR